MARQADQNNTTRPPQYTGKQPAGAVNMHKVHATGVGLRGSEAKALTEEQVEKKPR